MLKAYLLISGGDPRNIPSGSAYIEKIRNVKGVKQAHFAYGPHSGIGYVEVEDHIELWETVEALYDIGEMGKIDIRIAFP